MKMVKKLACGVVCAAVALGAASAWAAGLPEGYAEVEYIQGNGTNARILTDYTPNHLTDKIEAVVGWDAVDKTATIWCTRGATSSTDSWTVFMVNNSGYKFRLDYGTGKDGYASPLTVAANTKYTVTVEDKRIDVAGGSQPASYEYSQSSSFADAGPIMLFASYWNGTGNNLDNYGKNKLYSFKVWRSGNLIHYFVPCKDSNNVATMVDICDNPATLTKSGTFTAGGEGHYFDDTLFTIPDDTLAITGSPIDYGSPSPAYGKQTGLIAGETTRVHLPGMESLRRGRHRRFKRDGDCLHLHPPEPGQGPSAPMAVDRARTVRDFRRYPAGRRRGVPRRRLDVFDDDDGRIVGWAEAGHSLERCVRWDDAGDSRDRQQTVDCHERRASLRGLRPADERERLFSQ